MDTFIELQMPRNLVPENIKNTINGIIEEINSIYNVYHDDSEIWAINRAAYHKPVPVSRELFDTIQQSIYFYDISQGLFDVTFQPIQNAYGFNSGHLTIPEDDVLNQIIASIGSSHLILDEIDQTIAFDSSLVSINLSGIIKGLTLDNIGLYLESIGVDHYIINFGGEIKLRTPKTTEVFIQHPRNKISKYKLALDSGNISTSSDSQQFFIRDDTRYSHVVNPITGSAVNKSYSVSIVHPSSSMIADFLSTTLLLMEKEEAVLWVSIFFPEIKMVIIDQEGYHEWSNP